jgi:hypothetical protein
MTKAKAWKCVGQECNLRVTFALLKCEEMNPHIPKWNPTLGIGIPMEFQIFKEVFKGSKLIGLKNSLYHWNVLET